MRARDGEHLGAEGEALHLPQLRRHGVDEAHARIAHREAARAGSAERAAGRARCELGPVEGTRACEIARPAFSEVARHVLAEVPGTAFAKITRHVFAEARGRIDVRRLGERIAGAGEVLRGVRAQSLHGAGTLRETFHTTRALREAFAESGDLRARRVRAKAFRQTTDIRGALCQAPDARCALGKAADIGRAVGKAAHVRSTFRQSVEARPSDLRHALRASGADVRHARRHAGPSAANVRDRGALLRHRDVCRRRLLVFDEVLQVLDVRNAAEARDARELRMCCFGRRNADRRREQCSGDRSGSRSEGTMKRLTYGCPVWRR